MVKNVKVPQMAKGVFIMEFTEKMKAEAIRRMKELSKALDLNPKLVKYLEEGRVCYSYMVSGLFGCIDTINYDKRYAEIVDIFQEMYGGYVYHVIETRMKFGTMLSLLYVSKYHEDWAEQRLEAGRYIFAFVQNVDGEIKKDLDGEFGSVVLTSDNGALIRIS